LRPILLLPLILTMLGGRAARAQSNSDVRDLLRRGRFVFLGTVKQVGAANMPGVPVDARTLVASVDEIWQSPPAFPKATGMDITVQAPPRQTTPRAGQQLAFFSNAFVFGRTIAVRAVGVRDPGQNPAALRQSVANAFQSLADAELQAELANAAVVVLGVVRSVRPLDRQDDNTSEHDAGWSVATVAVESLEKGPQQFQQSLQILFIRSDDVTFSVYPRLHQDEEAIFILRDDQAQKMDPGVSGLTALQPIDIQNPDQLARIRRLLK
jgi:hypothetical protein